MGDGTRVSGERPIEVVIPGVPFAKMEIGSLNGHDVNLLAFSVLAGVLIKSIQAFGQEIAKVVMGFYELSASVSRSLGEGVNALAQKIQALNLLSPSSVKNEKGVTETQQKPKDDAIEQRALLLVKTEREQAPEVEVRETLQTLLKEEQSTPDTERARDLEKKTQNLATDIYEKDLNRGCTFQRSDRSLSIKDEKPFPPSTLSGEDRVERGKQLMNELIVTENDRRWITPLQQVMNQTVANVLIDTLITNFNGETPIELTKDEKKYKLKAVCSDQIPPIHIEVIRNSTTQEIETINFQMKGNLDIVRQRLNPFRIVDGTEVRSQKIDVDEMNLPTVFIPNAITGEMSFSMKLDQTTDQARFTDFKSNFTMNPQT